MPGNIASSVSKAAAGYIASSPTTLTLPPSSKTILYETDMYMADPR